MKKIVYKARINIESCGGSGGLGGVVLRVDKHSHCSFHALFNKLF